MENENYFLNLNTSVKFTKTDIYKYGLTLRATKLFRRD